MQAQRALPERSGAATVAVTPTQDLPPLGCALPADDEPLRVSLPLDLLDHLQRLSSSVFVHAFLVSFVAAPDAGSHRLSRCAREFLNAKPSDIKALRPQLPDAAEIIEALRRAELTRQSVLKIADSARSASALVARLDRDTPVANLDTIWTQIAHLCEADSARTKQAGACTPVWTMVKKVAAFRVARAERDRLSAQERQATDVLQASQKAQDATTRNRTSDTVAAVHHLEAAVNVGDSVLARRELDSVRVLWQPKLDSAAAAVAAATLAANEAGTRRQQVEKQLDSALQEMHAAATVVEALLKALPSLRQGLDKVSGPDINVRMSSEKAPAQLQATPNPSVPAASVLLQLTDFILDRARREAINSFVIDLYDVVRDHPVLQVGFPDSWQLMKGLVPANESHMSAVAVGRIPLTTWRATLTDDFLSFPVNLIEGGPVALCGGQGEAWASPTAAGTPSSCAYRVALLRPVAQFSRQLLQGERVLDILGRSGSFAAASAPGLPLGWRRVVEGLSVVASLADAYVVQGRVADVDVQKEPYILTVRSLAQVSPAQRDAFVRLLIVRAISHEADLPDKLDPTALYNAVVDGTRQIERLAASQRAADSSRAQLAQLVQISFAAIGDAVDVAGTIGGDSPMLDSVRTQWRAVSGTLEPLVGGDYGLALSRTVVLLRQLRGRDLPAPALTLITLASSLSDARDANQVQLAFEAAASPVGEWQEKRYGTGGATITAFPGLGAGVEWVSTKGINAAGAGEAARTVGVSLPVGIEWLFSYNKVGDTRPPNCKLGVVCAAGFFVPIVDLGALLSYRVSGSDAVHSEPNATMRQVFSPGLFLSFPLTRHIPGTLLLGGQFMPSLRSVDTPAGTESRSAWRVGANLGLDVTLFHF